LVANGGQKVASKQNVIRALDSVRQNVNDSPEHVEVVAEDDEAIKQLLGIKLLRQ